MILLLLACSAPPVPAVDTAAPERAAATVTDTGPAPGCSRWPDYETDYVCAEVWVCCTGEPINVDSYYSCTYYVTGGTAPIECEGIMDCAHAQLEVQCEACDMGEAAEACPTSTPR